MEGGGSHQADAFVEAVRQLPEVVECHVMAGDCDLLLRVVAQDLDAYRRFQVKHLTSLGMVQNVKTEVPMEKIKLTTELPV